MDIAQPVSSTISSISFSHLHSKDIRRISVKQVVNPVLFDNLNQPNAGGMYDPAFGPRGKGDICATCKLSSFDCPGHFGHIELPMPVFHPLYMAQVFPLLRGTCTYCHHFLAPEALILQFIAKLSLLEHGLVVQCSQVDSIKILVPEKAPKGTAGKAVNATLSDQEEGESTDEPGETVEAYEKRLRGWVGLMIKKFGKGAGRDEYKKSGIVYDMRKSVIAQFLKSLNKKRCGRCGAFAHRMRKEGSTRIVEYGLVGKQRMQHKAAGIHRRNVRVLQHLADNAVLEQQDRKVIEDELEEEEEEDSESEEDDSDDDAPVVNLNGKKGKGRQSDDSSDSSSEEDGSEADAQMDEDDRDPTAAAAADVVQLGEVKKKQTERIVPPSEVRAHLRLLFRNESGIVSLLYAPHGPLASASVSPSPLASTSRSPPSSRPKASADIFFMDVISVPPTRFRPAATMGDQVFENPQNSLLNAILRQTFTVRDLNDAVSAANLKPVEGEDQVMEEVLLPGQRPKLDGKRLYTQLLESLINLQVVVNSMVDSTKNPMIVKGGKLPPPGVKQLLEKKEGLFRMNMMGKRVNYAARSVISPDVNIETNEIGVPPIFARKLTFPEPVTYHNITQMRQLVLNGPHTHPGASFIQSEDGNLISLDRLTYEERESYAAKLQTPESLARNSNSRPDVGLPHTRTTQINQKVYRHLNDGDIVILNRQPTLHKPSMMCHRVRVLKGERTIRMHYANCNSYNADFDGDEMNMHFPQSLIAQAEARFIANTDNQYLVPTSGHPLRGLIQDHVGSGVWLTNKDTFFTREEYQQLIYGALRPEGNYTGGGKVLTVPPAIWKPQPLWTGKQVVSTILKNINPFPDKAGTELTFQCKGKVPGSFWGVHSVEETFLVFEGELVTGVLDKAQIGASPFGLVHSVHEIYGPEVAGQLLSILSRVLTKYLQSRAFTCRMDDLLLTDKGNSDRRKMLATVNAKGLDAALDYVGLSAANKDLPQTADDLRRRLEEVLRDDYKLAGLDATVEGETNQVTTQLIKACLPSGLVIPFPHNNMQMMTVSGAKGSNVNASQISCLLGQQSLEGRRVPTMVSGKTLPSFKAFETAPRAGGFVAGRFLTGIRPQEYYFHCMAGREGLIDTAVKTSRSGYLQRCLIKHLEGLRVHYDNTVRNSDSSILQFNYGEDSVDVTKKAHLGQIEFAVRNTGALVQRFEPQALMAKVVDVTEMKHLDDVLKHPSRFDPLLSVLNPATHLGVVSEPYAAAIEEYIKKNPQRLIKEKKDARAKWPKHVPQKRLMSRKLFRSLMYMRYLRALVQPGEAVGLLASQGVGEPSTQMTLNTFHFAGHGAANVTLGIPRLREIVMTASQHIRTPTMNLPVLAEISDETVQIFCQSSTRLTLSQIVDEVTVKESLSSKSEKNGFSRQKLYTVRLALYPQKDYSAEHSVSPEQILVGIQRSFVPSLDRAILKQIQQTDKELRAQAGDFGRARKEAPLRGADDVEDGEEDAPVARGTGEEDDGDADDDRRGRQAQDELTYDSDENEDKGSKGDPDSDSEAPAKKGGKKGKKAKDAEASLEEAFQSDDDDDSASSEEDEETTKKRVLQEGVDRMRTLESKIANASRYVNRVRFDQKDGGWCEFDLEFTSNANKLLLVGIVESCCRSAIVHEVAGISRTFVAKAANEKEAAKRMIVTEGVNLRGCWNFGYGVVDLNNIYTNEIGAILHTYGVEAARTSIIKEMSGVFSVYGIGVDYRHLTIIADYMTCEGGYKPFNRTGLSNNSSPFLKASFETTANFISEAALYGDFDDLGTPSANIVLGKPPKSGTGVFDVLAAVVA